MRESLKNSIRLVMELALLAGLTFYFRQPLFKLAGEVQDQYFPCSRPITYRLDLVDERFGVSREGVLAAVTEAAAVWDKAAGRRLFLPAADGESGSLSLDLIYDYRQEATAKLRETGLVIGDDRAAFDNLKAAYDRLKSELQAKKASFETAVQGFNARQSLYEQEVRRWNGAGGAPADEFERLNREGAAIEAQAAEMRSLQAEVNATVAEVNAAAVVLNRLIARLNLNAAEYNDVIQDRGQEFQEGVYRNGTGGAEIDIYEFEDRRQLVRVLTHELGHALGLEHTDDPSSVMYRLNEGQNAALAPPDIAALRSRCRLE